MSKNSYIGLFDSGVGGLTIWNEIIKLLPFENTLYIADSANAPYGERSQEEIIRLSILNTEKLIELGAKIIVVACNTATTQAIESLRQKFTIPFVGIEPAIKPAALASITKNIAVLATHGTLESEHFLKTKDRYTQDVVVRTQVGEGLVRAIESGKLNTKEFREILKGHLDKVVTHETDTLVLGCTHYPLFIPQIKEILGDRISIVDSGEPVAQQTKRILESNHLLSDRTNPGKHVLYTTGNLQVLKQIVGVLNPGKDADISYSDSLYQSE
jgi:glutamate racemase